MEVFLEFKDKWIPADSQGAVVRGKQVSRGNCGSLEKDKLFIIYIFSNEKVFKVENPCWRTPNCFNRVLEVNSYKITIELQSEI